MIFSLSNKTFYKRHNEELVKYIINKKSLHICAKPSKIKISEKLSTKLFIDVNNIEGCFEDLDERFDVIVLTDVVETIDDINYLLINVKKLLNKNGKLILSTVNPKYYLLIKLLEVLKFKQKNNKLSYIHSKKINKVVNGQGFEFIYANSKQIIPFKIFGIGNLLNSFLEIIFYIFNIGIKTYTVFRIQNKEPNIHLSKTIIVPAKNEEGNLKPLISRLPIKSKFEIIIACGNSQDGTLSTAYEIENTSDWHEVKVIKQSKDGKANAVWEALDHSTGDLVAILDADMSVDPEIIDDFFNIIEQDNADFVNGTRLVYEMEDNAMRYINKIGNRAFQFLISKVINVPLTDSLCGTKVFRRELIECIEWWQKTYKLHDPFGDFDLLFTAAVTGEKIVELPVHYKSRVYGSTQISRFRDGFKLIKYMVRSYLIFNSSRFIR